MTELTPTPCVTCGHTPEPKRKRGRPKGTTKYTPAELKARTKANIKKWVDNNKAKRAAINRENYRRRKAAALNESETNSD